MIIEFLEGFFLGTAVGAFNYFMTVFALGNLEKTSGQKAKVRIGAVFFLRYVLNFLTLFLVYKHVPMLIGAGLALAAMTHIMVIKNIRRKG